MPEKLIEVKVARYVQIDDDRDVEDAAHDLLSKALDAYRACMALAMEKGLIPADGECRIDVAMMCRHSHGARRGDA